MSQGINEREITVNILNTIRNLSESNDKGYGLLTEEDKHDEVTADAIAITDSPMFGQNVLSNQINQFRSSVESGAQFSKPDESKVSECPLIFMPSTNNLVFSGVIPCLNNLKWQFVLKTNTGKGCFMWADGLILNKDNLQILNKLWGFYENWREQWNSESADLERMVRNIQSK